MTRGSVMIRAIRSRAWCTRTRVRRKRRIRTREIRTRMSTARSNRLALKGLGNPRPVEQLQKTISKRTRQEYQK